MVAEALKRQLRSFQTFFPGIRSAKFASYNWSTRNLGWRVEPEFKLLKKLGSCSVAIDIGGNWGQSIYAFRRYGNPQRTISFEPNPQLSMRLQKLFANDPSVQIEGCALGAEPGEFDLYLPSYRGFVFDGLASLDHESAATWLNPARMAGFDPKKLHITKAVVQVRTLDSYDLEPDVIKIDVQGLEEAVVAGAEKTIARSQPALIIEAPSDSLVQRLAAWGLQQYGLSDGELIPGDRSHCNSMFLSDAKRSLFGK